MTRLMTAATSNSAGAAPSRPRLPLSDVVVVEFSHMVMGPAAGVILADLGALVTKVEPVGGDNTRRLQGSGGGYFAMYNRNKRSLCVDLKNAEGRDLVRRLIDKADVVIENFRPGAMEKLGFGYAELAERNHRLVYCSLKGFLKGPYEQRAALDEVTQMMGGLAYMTGLPGRPMRAGSSVVDIAGGMFGVIAILAALNERRATGRGQLVTSALFETTAFLVGQHMAQQAALGEAPPPMSVRRSAWGVYDLFSCAGGEQIFVAIVSDTQWRAFRERFQAGDHADLAALLSDPALETNRGRVDNRDRLIPALTALFGDLALADAAAALDGAGLPFAEVRRPADLFDDPHLAAGGLTSLHITDGPRRGAEARLPKLPLEMAGRRLEARLDIPHAGEHSREVAERAGCAQAQLEDLVRRGIVAAG